MISKQKLTHFGLPLMAASIFALPFATPSAGALVSIGDQTSLFFNGSATAQYNDNLFLESNDEESDMVFIFAPGIELNVGTRQNANINLFYREDFYVYNDNSDLDRNLSNVFFESYWKQARLDLRLNASFEQLITPNPSFFAQGILVERDVLKVDFNGEYEISELTSISSGINYTDTQFDQAFFLDRDVIAVPVNFYYALTPMVDLSAGYRLRETSVEGGASDFTDHYFNVGARGEIFPKLIGEARVGFQERQVDGANDDESGLTFGLDFSHFTTAKTTLTTGFFRDFETGGVGEIVTTTGVSVGARHSFSHLISGNAGLSYYERDYEASGREDDTLQANLGVTYSPTEHVDLSAGYTFRTNDSNAGLDFDNNVFTVSAGLRY